MANKRLFGSLFGKLFPAADAVNEAGGRAYRLPPKHALAQLAATGCFNNTYYADADQQLDTLLALAGQVEDNAFLARLAVYSRERAFLKDMPATLFAAAVLRRNPGSVVIPFDTDAYDVPFDAGTPILRLAEQLARFGGGGTNCSLPLARANSRLRDRTFAGVVLVSDNESWVGAGRHQATAVLTEWRRFVDRQAQVGNPSPKLVCIDLQPNTTTQAPEGGAVLNVGGFSDAVFEVIAGFLDGDPGRFVKEVEAVEL